MGKVFGTYGEYYDIFYSDKNYEQECDFIQEIFKKYSSFPVTNILDAGCVREVIPSLWLAKGSR